MKNYFDYRKKATKTLKAMCELYEEIPTEGISCPAKSLRTASQLLLVRLAI